MAERDEIERSATDKAPAETGSLDTSRRNLLRLTALGGAAIATVRPNAGLAQAATSALKCQIPIPDSANAGKWIKSDGTLVKSGTSGAYAPPSTPLVGEDVKNSLSYGTRYSGYTQQQTNAYNNYIKKLTVGKQGYTCYASVMTPR
ncbi:hypothetical protein [Sphingomonas crocodyli]|uniref:Twin-arginine translocation signal domain-containing protein n=1 Tax=Sphingomonas crocodyli TaxID=1979270 RepID=A0A437M923_9SPHN|nr:hypothetical protein [Sphingomonas crocodyli]RVT94149.1 hypothetical protein EOD43_09935 [Sphingomonas crocodyli]